jgi:hypothetical protein
MRNKEIKSKKVEKDSVSKRHKNPTDIKGNELPPRFDWSEKIGPAK